MWAQCIPLSPLPLPAQPGLSPGCALPCALSRSLCPSPGAASGARGQPALQLKQRKVRVSRRELCPRLKKHILAEERNTIQAGRETRLPSNPLQEVFGSLQLLESLLPVTGLFIFTGFHVFVFCLLDRCCRGDRAEQRLEGTALHRGTGSPASLSFLSLSHCVALGHCHFPLCLGSSAMGWFHPAQLSACLPSLSLRSFGGVLGEALPGQGRHSPGPVLFSFPKAAGAAGSQGVGG